MNIIISHSSDVPIYEQIEKEIKQAIETKTLKENEMLPSMRSLARDLRVSVLTVKRAYDELEKEHYITTVQGKGSFVLPQNTYLTQEKQLKKMERYMEEIITIAKISGVSKQEIWEMFDYFYEVNSESKICDFYDIWAQRKEERDGRRRRD